MHSTPGYLKTPLFHLAFASVVIVLWALSHGYQGLTGDAQIYAFQALARIKPNLSTDLYLQNTSQDQFTLFSPLYAAFIRAFGIDYAASILTTFFSIWITAAAWWVAAMLVGNRIAWLCIASLIMASADYGASRVFHYSEYFLTARLPAQAFIVTAIAIHLSGRHILGLCVATAALALHPLMALPGILVLLALVPPFRVVLGAALSIVLLGLGLSIAVTEVPQIPQLLKVMDPDWVNVVRERSQFLFLQLWTYKDWDTNIRPFLLLAFAMAALGDAIIWRLGATAMVVGATGLLMGVIAGSVGPVALLLQGQAWRWVWVAFMLSVLLFPSALLKIWREERCGSLCACLLIASWLISNAVGTAAAFLGLLCWSLRNTASSRALRWSRWAAFVVALATTGWATIASRQTIHWTPSNPSHSLSLSQIEGILDIRLMTGVAIVLLWRFMQHQRTAWTAAFIFSVFLTVAAIIVPTSYHAVRRLVPDSNEADLSEWSRWIPLVSTVLVTPTHDAGGFVWFNLARPNYLALDQSAGAVFSRETSMEVQRRSDVLLPLMNPSWKILSNMHSTSNKWTPAAPHILTAAILVQLCMDPELGFVITPEYVGFRPWVNTANGWWKNWNLYDCRQVNS